MTKLSLALLCAACAQGGTISVQAVYGGCSQSADGQSAAAVNCGTNAAASGTYGGNLVGDVSAQESKAYLDPAPDSASASIQDVLSEFLVVDGASGTGVLTLTFAANAWGTEDGVGSTSGMTFSTNYGVLPFSPTFNCIDAGVVCQWNDAAAVSFAIPVTFGTPFLFTESYGLFAHSYDPSLTASATAHGGVSMTAWSAADANGSPLSGVELSDPPAVGAVPEPGTWGLMVAGLLAGYARRFRWS